MAQESKCPAVYPAIISVMADLGKVGISKDHKNQMQGYRFRGIDDVLNTLNPILVKHKLCIIPRYKTREIREYKSKSGGDLFNVAIEAEFDFVSAVDGSTHTARLFGEGMDSSDKATNKAESAAFKYLCFQTFCIPTDEIRDTDADNETPETVGRKNREPAKPRKTNGVTEDQKRSLAEMAKSDCSVVANYVKTLDVSRLNKSDVDKILKHAREEIRRWKIEQTRKVISQAGITLGPAGTKDDTTEGLTADDIPF